MDDAALGVPDADPVLDRERWSRDRLGSVLARQRELSAAVIEAPRSGRSAARIELARFLMANRLDPEAVGVLLAAALDDPTLRGDGRSSPQGIANMRMGRLAEAQKYLPSCDRPRREDPEAVLWRAALDAVRSEMGGGTYRPSARVAARSENYPDDCRGLSCCHARGPPSRRGIRLCGSRAIRLRPSRTGPIQWAKCAPLARALDEALGRPEAPSTSTAGSWDDADRPTARRRCSAGSTSRSPRARCSPRGHRAARDAGRHLARRRRRGRARSAMLGRLYAEAGRWREAFTDGAAGQRRSSRTTRSPAPCTRKRRGCSKTCSSPARAMPSPGVDSLALYFDFQEFTPIGRRGDEIVRRLADRLVALDLLDQAADAAAAPGRQPPVRRRPRHRRGPARDGPADGRQAGSRARRRSRSTRLPELPQSVQPGPPAARGAGPVRPVAHRSRPRGAGGREAAPRSIACAPTSCGPAGAGARPARPTSGSSATRWQGQAPLERAGPQRSAAGRRSPIRWPTMRWPSTGCATKFAAKMADSRGCPHLRVPDRSRTWPRTRAFRDLARKVDERRHARRLPRRIPQALSRKPPASGPAVRAAGRSRSRSRSRRRKAPAAPPNG